MSMPVPHPATLYWGKSETTTVLVLVSDTVQRIVTVRYNTVLADSDTSTVPYGPAAHRRVSVQNFTARIRNCTESNGHTDRMTVRSYKTCQKRIKMYGTIRYPIRFLTLRNGTDKRTVLYEST